jgi:ribA/ribD-fused uncharacterized protein
MLRDRLTHSMHRARKRAKTLEASVNEIHFYLPTECPYGALSNYYRRPLLFNGVRYISAEHAYQCAKAKRPMVREWVAQAPTSILAAVAGDGLPEDEILGGWESSRIPLMRAILRVKFTQHEDLRTLLVSTGDQPLVEWVSEDSASSPFWSKINGEGLNMLGQLLMELRSDLRSSDCPNVEGAKSPHSKTLNRSPLEDHPHHGPSALT